MKRSLLPEFEKQSALNEKIDFTLERINISFKKALMLHQAGKVDMKRSLGELSAKLGAISVIQEELLASLASLRHDEPE